MEKEELVGLIKEAMEQWEDGVRKVRCPFCREFEECGDCPIHERFEICSGSTNNPYSAEDNQTAVLEAGRQWLKELGETE